MAIKTIDLNTWQFPALPDEIPHGDMPGDKVEIGEKHIRKAQTIFPLLMERLEALDSDRAVVSVYGGSGVGKSGTTTPTASRRTTTPCVCRCMRRRARPD